MKRTSSLIILLTFAVLISGLSQPSSYREDANDYFKKSFSAASQRDTVKALLYADSMRLVYANAEDAYGETMYLFSLGVIERSKGNTKKFKKFITEFIDGAKEKRDTAMLASAYYQLAIASGDLGNLDESIQNHYESMSYYEMSGDSTSKRHSLNMIGSIYRKLKQYDEAERHFLEALEINEKGEFLSGQADNLVNLGNLYGELEEYDKAIDAYRRATTIDSLTNFSWGLSYDYENLGNLMARQSRFDEALAMQKKSLTIREKLGGKFELGQSNLKIGEIYQSKGQNLTALQYLNNALDYATQASAAESQRDIYKALYRTQKALGNYNQALDYQEAYVTLNDSLLNQSTAEKITTLSVQYETAQKGDLIDRE